MKTISALLFSFSLFFSGSVLSAANIKFDGEVYSNKYTKNSPPINLVEYVRKHESLKKWTKLIAVRNYTNLSNPKDAVTNLAKIVKQHNPKANFQIIQSKDKTEAQIDFLTWPKSLEYMEFNIHRYMKVKGYKGLISYQFAYRFNIKDAKDVKLFKDNKNHWVSEMVKAKFKIDFDK